jgi:Chlorophyll A-B binding protein
VIRFINSIVTVVVVVLTLCTCLAQFDPVGLAQWAPVEYLRKAELSNGRSAMLANVGWFWPTLVGRFESDDVTTTDPIEAIGQADLQWWAQFALFCGVIESIKYQAEQEGKSYTGEGPAAIDWTGQWAKLNDKQKEDMRLKELKNGRLAMLGFASYVADYYIPGSVPGMPHF